MYKSRFIVVGYFTENTLYEGCVTRFVNSMIVHKVPHCVQKVPNLGSWERNTAHKPTFIKQMLKEHDNPYIVYVDCDAEFLSYPILFDELSVDIAVHFFERNYNRPAKRKEILSGTIFLANNERVREIVSQWEELCQTQPKVWDQRNLGAVIGDNYFNLPPEYCTIYDRMGYVERPIILHHQMSRIVRKNHGRLVG